MVFNTTSAGHTTPYPLNRRFAVAIIDSGPAITLADDHCTTKTLPSDQESHLSAGKAEFMSLNSTSAQKHDCTTTQ
jgi:hypothetical protein